MHFLPGLPLSLSHSRQVMMELAEATCPRCGSSRSHAQTAADAAEGQFQAWDVNRDGVVDREEWIQGRLSQNAQVENSIISAVQQAEVSAAAPSRSASPVRVRDGAWNSITGVQALGAEVYLLLQPEPEDQGVSLATLEAAHGTPGELFQAPVPCESHGCLTLSCPPEPAHRRWLLHSRGAIRACIPTSSEPLGRLGSTFCRGRTRRRIARCERCCTQ
jgi:hypothetical protein